MSPIICAICAILWIYFFALFATFVMKILMRLGLLVELAVVVGKTNAKKPRRTAEPGCFDRHGKRVFLQVKYRRRHGAGFIL